MRITFVKDKEIDEYLKTIRKDYEVLSVSKKYNQRGISKLKSVYIDLERKQLASKEVNECRECDKLECYECSNAK